MTKLKTNKTILLLILLIVSQRFVSILSGLIADLFDYSFVDPYNIFARISVHHIAQLLFAIIATIILSKILDLDFGFHLGDKKTGVKHTGIFLIAMFIYISVLSVVSFLSNKSFQYSYPLNYPNVLGTLGFQLFLSGTSEEVLFRALPITLMIQYTKLSKRFKIGKIELSITSIVAALFFAIAHINLSFNPFSLSYDLGQLLFSFILGIIYGIIYEKSKSVIYPMIMHSVTNVAIVGSGYLMSYLETIL